MGLDIGKNYSENEVQDALRTVTGNNGLIVTIKKLGSTNATLIVAGEQLASSFSAKGDKIVWAQKIQDLVKKATGGNTLDWSSS
jgi:hypothetical protein